MAQPFEKPVPGRLFVWVKRLSWVELAIFAGLIAFPLAGFVLAQLQRIPRAGDAFEFEGRRYTVVEMDGLRIARVKVELAAPRPVHQ